MQKFKTTSDLQKNSMLEYEQFKKKFQFIYLQGLKGLQRACQIQEKLTNKLFDYAEQTIKINIYNPHKDTQKIDNMVLFCEKLLQIENKNILKLNYYSRYFAEESLGEPYCKYLLIFEYSESSVENEILHLQKSKKFLKKSQIKKIFYALGSALDFFHSKGQLHGDLRASKIMKNENGDYKLMPPRIQHRNPKDFYIYSPEEYEQKNFRLAYESRNFDPLKSEIFSLGVLLLEIGTFTNSQELYGKFDMKGKQDILDQRILLFQTMYGYHLGQVIKKCLEPDPQVRIDANDFRLLLDSQELSDQEKIWNQTQKQSLQNKFHLQKLDTQNSISSQLESAKSRMGNLRNKFSTLKKINQGLIVGKTVQAVKYWEKEYGEEKEETEEYLQRIFETLPQEYQEEIDSKVSHKIKEIELTHEILYVPDGNRYQGELDHNQPHGWGSFWWSNGELYEGQFVNGKQNGYGIYFWPNGDKYYGEFFNGQINGIGVRFYERGIDDDKKRTIDCYFGEWAKGQNHGKGTFYWQDKAKFKGNFIQDCIYGKGTLIVQDIEELGEERYYEGLWKDEKGEGISVEKGTVETGIDDSVNKKQTNEKRNSFKTQNKQWKQISKIPLLAPLKTKETEISIIE